VLRAKCEDLEALKGDPAELQRGEALLPSKSYWRNSPATGLSSSWWEAMRSHSMAALAPRKTSTYSWKAARRTSVALRERWRDSVRLRW
jgi:hypothetical protein